MIGVEDGMDGNVGSVVVGVEESGEVGVEEGSLGFDMESEDMVGIDGRAGVGRMDGMDAGKLDGMEGE